MLKLILLVLFSSIVLTKRLRADYFGAKLNSIRAIQELKWMSCGSADDQLTLHSLRVTPDPPQRGTNLTISVSATLSEMVTFNSTVLYSVFFGPILLLRDTMPLCDLLQQEPKLPQCPIQRGNIQISHQVELPMIVPKGNYKIKVEGSNEDGGEIFCVEIITKVI